MTTIPQTAALTVIMQADPGRAEADAAIQSVQMGGSVFRFHPSEAFFHQLRLRVAKEPGLADKIAVLYVDSDGSVKPIGLREADELGWPPGFLHEGWEIETEILRARQTLPSSGEGR